MEQGIIASIIGILIFFLGILYGFKVGKKYGTAIGVQNGLAIGSINTYGLLEKSGVISIELKDKDFYDFTIRSINDKSISADELEDIARKIYQNGEPIVGGNIEAKGNHNDRQ